MMSISRHIMPLVINSFRGADTHTHILTIHVGSILRNQACADLWPASTWFKIRINSHDCLPLWNYDFYYVWAYCKCTISKWMFMFLFMYIYHTLQMVSLCSIITYSVLLWWNAHSVYTQNDSCTTYYIMWVCVPSKCTPTGHYTWHKELVANRPIHKITGLS